MTPSYDPALNEKLISLAEQKQTLSLDELSKELGIADRATLEEFLIDSIHSGVINGKIDELNGQLLVTFHQQREFGQAQWEDLQTRMSVLVKNLEMFRENLQLMTEEETNE